MSSETQHSDGHQLDPVIVDAVRNISNRFGVAGLEDLIGLASRDLEEARAALAELQSLED